MIGAEGGEKGRGREVTEIPEVGVCSILQATVKGIGNHRRIVSRGIP